MPKQIAGGFRFVTNAPRPSWGSELSGRISTFFTSAAHTTVTGGGRVVLAWRDTQSSGDESALRSEDHNDIAIAWDARLDNAVELRNTLSLTDADAKPRPESTAGLLIASYQRWKRAFLEHLVGDYALALWDSNESELILARDPFGIRPLYYSSTTEELYFSSSLEWLVSVTEKPHRLDDQFVAGFLTYTEESDRTPYTNIRAVRPGSLIIFSPNGFRVETFWTAEPKETIRYKSDADYAEAFVHLFEEGLASRMEVRGPVLAELSGGLDSSSIVCTANRLLARGQVSATSLHTVSFQYDGAPSVDEFRFMELVSRKTDVPNVILRDEHILSPDRMMTLSYAPNPHRWCASTFEQSTKLFHDLGAKILLSGMCGDHVFVNDVSHLSVMSYHLTRGHLGTIHRLAKLSAKYANVSYWHTIWLGAVWPWLPSRVRARLSPKRMRAPAWIDPGFSARTDCTRRGLAEPAFSKWLHPSARHRCSLVQNAVSVASSQYYREQTGVEVAFPYLHLPLVQFLLSIPPDQFFRPHEDRSIQRRAMRNILPEEIRTRTDKKGPSESMLIGFKRHWPQWERVLKSPLTVRLGIVKPEIAAALQRMRFGTLEGSSELLRWLSLEAWLQCISPTKVLAM